MVRNRNIIIAIAAAVALTAVSAAGAFARGGGHGGGGMGGHGMGGGWGGRGVGMGFAGHAAIGHMGSVGRVGPVGFAGTRVLAWRGNHVAFAHRFPFHHRFHNRFFFAGAPFAYASYYDTGCYVRVWGPWGWYWTNVCYY